MYLSEQRAIIVIDKTGAMYTVTFPQVVD
jgi:hypothetical protein